MIEDRYAGSPGSVLDQLFDLRIVHRFQLLSVEEIRNIGFVLDEYKTLLFQRKPIGEQAAIPNFHLHKLMASRLSPANVVRAESLVRSFSPVSIVYGIFTVTV